VGSCGVEEGGKEGPHRASGSSGLLEDSTDGDFWKKKRLPEYTVTFLLVPPPLEGGGFSGRFRRRRGRSTG